MLRHKSYTLNRELLCISCKFVSCRCGKKQGKGKVGLSVWVCLGIFILLKQKSSEPPARVWGVCRPEQTGGGSFPSWNGPSAWQKGVHPSHHKLEMCLFFPFQSFLMCRLQPFSFPLNSGSLESTHNCPSLSFSPLPDNPLCLYAVFIMSLSPHQQATLSTVCSRIPPPCLSFQTIFPFFSPT